MKDLLDDNNCVALATTRSDRTSCLWTGKPIGQGVRSVILRRDIEKQSRGVVWLSVNGADELRERLEEFHAYSHMGEKVYFGADENAGYYEVKTGNRYACFVCGDELEKGTPVFFFSRGNTTRNNSVRLHCHVNCAEPVVRGLERVWDNVEDILPSQL